MRRGLWDFVVGGPRARASLGSFVLAGSLLSGVMTAVAQDATIAEPAVQTGEVRRVVVRFLTEGEFPPFNYVDDEGVLAGFNVDLARALCQELSAACDIKVRPWEELVVGLKRGDADAVIAAQVVTAKALADVEFSDRYFYTPGRFAGRTGSASQEINPDELDGVTVGVARGTAHEAFLRAYFRDSRIMLFENPELAREALQQSKVQLIFDDGISLAFWLNGSLARQCCELKGGPYLDPKFFGDGLAIAIARTDPQMRVLINDALKRVRENGRFQELVERYFPTRIY